MNRLNELFKIKYPIVQGGMVWCSGWRLASAVSNNGGLGLIGSGSMYPDVFKEHIKKCKKGSNNSESSTKSDKLSQKQNDNSQYTNA